MLSVKGRNEMLVRQACSDMLYSKSTLKRQMSLCYLTMLSRTTPDNAMLVDKHVKAYTGQKALMENIYTQITSVMDCKRIESAYHSISKL